MRGECRLPSGTPSSGGSTSYAFHRPMPALTPLRLMPDSGGKGHLRMTEDQLSAKLEELSMPPVIPPATKHERLRHVVGYVSLSIGVVSLAGVIGLSVQAAQQSSLSRELAAIARAQSQCINADNAARNAPNDADRRAIDETFGTIAKALLTPGANTIVDVRGAIAQYQAQRKIDDATRAANPIGQC